MLAVKAESHLDSIDVGDDSGRGCFLLEELDLFCHELLAESESPVSGSRFVLGIRVACRSSHHYMDVWAQEIHNGSTKEPDLLLQELFFRCP